MKPQVHEEAERHSAAQSGTDTSWMYALEPGAPGRYEPSDGEGSDSEDDVREEKPPQQKYLI